MDKGTGGVQQQCLTPPENAAIIAALFAVDAKEKRLARQVVWLQLAITLITTGIAYRLNGAPQYAMAVLSGGLLSALNGTLLAWRMSRVALHSAHESHSSDVHHQLRLMYFYAAERFLVVMALLGLCMALLKLPLLAVLVGFVVGQAVLLTARLLLNRLNKS